MAGRAGAGAVLLACVGPAGLPAAATAATVEAGPLRALTDADPWHLAFTDARGRTVLSESRGSGGGATGRLGFRTPAGWFRATRELSARRDGERRWIAAFPRGVSSARMDDGGLLKSRELRGRWQLGIRSRLRKRWHLQASMATLRRPLRVCSVSVRGRRLSRRRWSYDRKRRVLRATFALRNGRLVARACKRR